jgi:hypothetical protein
MYNHRTEIDENFMHRDIIGSSTRLHKDVERSKTIFNVTGIFSDIAVPFTQVVFYTSEQVNLYNHREFSPEEVTCNDWEGA